MCGYSANTVTSAINDSIYHAVSTEINSLLAPRSIRRLTECKPHSEVYDALYADPDTLL